MSDADKWPKSFRWHFQYAEEQDIVTFSDAHDIDTDLQGITWTYGECARDRGEMWWVPTDQHNRKSPPAPSQDDVKAEDKRFVDNMLEECRMFANNNPIRAIKALADAVERLAK